MDEFEEFSGIEEPKVLEKIKAILDEYRNDVQIIKELIQNADDAEATQMKILYDGRNLIKEVPGEKEYRKFFRAPALAIYNDAVFTDDDWRGIKSIYISVKKDDPLKVGRFGLGFKSVFHLTDYPCIISGQYALFIDPMEEDSKRICTMIKLTNLPKWSKLNLEDVMLSLTGIYGISEEVFDSGYYNGTLFWFPLRQTPSKLSDDVYTEIEVSILLNAFLHDSDRSLLFLKTLCQIQLYCNLTDDQAVQMSASQDGSVTLGSMNLGRQKPHFVVEINNDERKLLSERKSFLKELKAIGRDIQERPKSWVFNVGIETKTTFPNGEIKASKARWLIVNYLKGGDMSETMIRLLNDKQLGYPHIVAMAAPIHTRYNNKGGHIFCYQPLPQHSESMTGLPVHINGFFALSQNRRQVAWPDVGENEFIKDKKIEWNRTLTSEILPNAYLALLIEMIKQSELNSNVPLFVDAAINSLPDLMAVDPNWKELAETFVLLCKNREILYSETGNGQWVKVHDAVFADFRRYPELSKGSQKTIINLLRKDGVKVVVIPGFVVDTFRQTFTDVTCVSQEFLAEHMKTSETYKQLTSSKRQDLLEYFSQDSSYQYLVGLELVPLADGSFSSFSNDKQLFVEPPEIIQLFPGSAGRFVASKLRQKTKAWIMDVVEKGTSCLQHLTAFAAADLVERVLNDNFDDMRSLQIPSEDVKKWKEWVRNLWDLIQSRFMDSLDNFDRLSIFPYVIEQNWNNVTQLKLLPLNSLILHLKNVEKRDDVCKAFELLSVTVVQYVPNWLSENIRRTFLWYSENIGEMFNKVSMDCIRTFNMTISGTGSACLLEFLSQRVHDILEEHAKDLLQQLYILRGHSSLTSSELCSLRDHNAIYLGENFPVRFPAVYIRISNKLEQDFVLKYLGGHRVTELELVSTAVDHCEKYTQDEVKRLMLWILSTEQYFCIQSIQDRIKEVSFLEADNGQNYKPTELFDPSEKYLPDLFRGKNVFPSKDLCSNHTLLPRLRTLGLKGVDRITVEDIEMVASEVEKMSTNKVPFDESKCKALLFIMDKRMDIINKARMYDKRCILVEKDAVENYPRGIALRNKKSKASSLICQPSDIKSTEFANVVGSVKFMIRSKYFSNLSQLFQWQTLPDINDVVHHLFNIVQSYEKKMKSQCLQMIVDVYSWLSKQDINLVNDALNSRFASISNTFVWADDGFHAPQEVYIEASDHDIDMRPFIHNIPTETSQLKCFFAGIGCTQFQSLKMYVDTITQIKCLSHKTEEGVDDLKLLTLAVDILNRIKTNFLNDPDFNEDELYFPVLLQHESSKWIMQPTKKCTFCDSQWLEHMSFELDNDVYYVHPDIQKSTAEALGVPSIRQQMLADAIPIEEWGQEEPLTRRLHALLEDGYIDGFSVAKELFQNADDAGARKLWIMYDERENNDFKTSLLSKGMAECQGPAIWVYNDARFEESDFENITKLNGATKANDAEKIGKFGLGFCSVYNITDVPSFVSGHSVVMFDPHMTFLDKALPGKSPGLRINLKCMKNRKMVTLFRDQFQPFEGIFNCKIIKSEAPEFNGTLFRLPLRNKGSYISDIVYTSSEVKRLFEKIMQLSANMFVFNQNVVELKLFHLPKGAKNPRDATPLFEVKKTLLRLLPSLSSAPSCPVSDAVKRKRSNSLAKSPLKMIDENKIEVTQHGNSDFNTNSRCSCLTWLVSWSTALEQKCQDLSQSEKGALPLAAIAIPVVHNDNRLEVLSLSQVTAEFYKHGHLFFYLPLPITHQFAFHINSQFTVSPDRKTLRVRCEDDKITKMAQWNECLFHDPITQALLHLLENIHTIGTLKNYHFEQLWPQHSQAFNTEFAVLDYMSKSFFRKVVTPNSFKLFERDGKWFDISECVFLDRDLLSSELGQYALECLSQICPFAVDISSVAYNRLMQENKDLINKLTVSKHDFFLKYFLPNLATFEANPRRHELMCYAIKLNNEDINEWIKSNECIPNLAKGDLRKPDELVDPSSPLAVLFKRTDTYFPEQTFSHHSVLEEMRSLGLMHKTLNNDILLLLVNSVQKEGKRCNVCSSELAGHLIEYVIDNFTTHKAIMEELQQSKFIPVRKTPPSWPFEWHAHSFSNMKEKKKCKDHKSDGTVQRVAFFDCASKVFHTECQFILGTVCFIFEDSVLNKRHNKPLEEKAFKKLGMSYKCDLDWRLVLSHLDTIIETYEKGCNPTSTSENALIMQNIHTIYQFFDEACSENFDAISKKLMGRKSVFVSNRFVNPSVITKEPLPAKCHPHIFQLDETELRSFKTLVKCLEITDQFEPYTLAVLLQNIKTNQAGKPLNTSEVHAVLNLLFCLKTAMEKHKVKNAKTIIKDKLLAIYGPDENGNLHDCSTMCFNDFDDIEKTETMIYAHKMLAPELAEFFGVLPKRLRYIEENSEDIVDFFQNEPLVVRLRRILEGFPCDTGLFKELIQNADDAKATKMYFIKDVVQYTTENTTDSGFEHALGPSLCVYNNSAFSKEDLEAICKLGVGNKADDSAKTGHYGIGFNAVYNLTDAPSFYTRGGDIENGETLCYFDPLASFFPLVTREKPGKRIKNMEAVRGISKNIMTSYHEKCIPQGEKGTIFRLPLRKQSSEIKDECSTMESLSTLLDSLSKELRDILVFLKHLKEVCIVSHTRHGYVEDYRINMVMDEGDCLARERIFHSFYDLGGISKKNPEATFKYSQHSEVYKMSLIETHKNSRSKVSQADFLVAMTVGFKQDTQCSDVLRKKFEKGKIKMLPVGGVAVCVENATTSFKQMRRKRRDTNPVYCFLPLPVTTTMPVLVNGYFALDNETRRNIWGSGNIDVEHCWRTQWNVLIIENTITQAYIKLLDYTKDQIFTGITGCSCDPELVHQAIKNYQDFFPVSEKLTEYWKMLACSVYSDLVRERNLFLPVQETITNMFSGKKTQCKLSWTSLHVADHKYPAYVNAETVNSHGSEHECNSELNGLLRKVGMRVVFLKESIVISMHISANKIPSLSPDNVIEFLCSWSGDALDKCKITPGVHIGITPLGAVKNAQTIFEYCLASEETFLKNILEIPLFVTEDMTIFSFKDGSPRYLDKTGKYCTFFLCKKNMFIHKDIAIPLVEKYGQEKIKSQKLLQPFHLEDFLKLANLTKTIPTDCLICVPWDCSTPSEEWIHLFWEFFENELEIKNVTEVRDRMKVIETIPLIPVANTTTNFLVPPRDIKRIINLESFSSNFQLHSGLSKLNLPVINKSLFLNDKNEPFTIYEKLSVIVPNIQDSVGVLECLFLHVKNLCELHQDHASAEAILHFFDDGCGSAGELLTSDLLPKLKKMTLFQSHFNKLVKLSDYKTIHTVPSHLRSEGLEEIADTIKVLFLKDIPFQKLFKCLKVTKLTMFDVYIKYIIPNQAKLRRKSFYRHLEFLSDFIRDDNNSLELISRLKDIQFVETTDHTFVKVSNLYDPYHEVFKVMCKQCEIVPTNLRKKKLVDMFRKLGLHDKMTVSLFERFASDIESHGNTDGLSDDLLKKSELLSKHLLKMDERFLRDGDFQRLSNIKFVVPRKVQQELAVIHDQFNAIKLIPFRGSVLYKHENICWTVCNLLHVSQDNVRSGFEKRLNICTQPDSATLIKHLENVGRSVETMVNSQSFNSSMHEIVSKVFHDIYSALSRHEHGMLQRCKMLDSPVIYFPDAKMVLPPKMVVLTCKEIEEVSPYFCMCPSAYGMFHNLFLNLGVNKEPTCSSYSSVLCRIKMKVGKNPDSFVSDALKATGNFLKLLSQNSIQVDIAEECLYLMSRQGTLEKARCLLVSNNKFFEDQVLNNGVARNLFLVGVDKLASFHLTTDDIVNGLQWLPETHRPHLLTDVVHEQVILQNIRSKDAKIANRLEHFIHGRHFLHGVLRLVSHVRKCQSKQFLDSDKNKIITELRKITCKHCSTIQTVIAMRDIENGELGQFTHINNTTEIKYVHLEKNEDGARIYFDTADLDWFGSVQKSLTLYLNKEKGLGLQDEYQMRLEEIIALFPSPSGIERHLSKHKIDDFQFQFETEDSSNVPIVGNFVPEEMHQFLDNTYGNINENEYKFMALEIDDPLYYLNYDRKTQFMDPTYIFVHIIRKMQPIMTIHLLQEYEIDDGTEHFKIVMAHKLYKFTHKPKEWENTTDEQSNHLTLKEVCKQVKELLIVAWKKTENEKKSIVKRLLYKWHPDKNPGNAEFCTKVFQFIQQCINALENNTQLPNEASEGAPTSPPSGPFRWERSWYNHYWNNYREARRRPSRPRESYPDFYHFWTSYQQWYTERRPYKWCSEARRWLKQATHDLYDARLSLRRIENPAFNWICYRAYQAAEKALIAAWFARDAYKANEKKHSERLSCIAQGLDPRLYSLADELDKLTGGSQRMRYPNHFGIPQDLYIKQNAEKAFALSDCIIKRVEETFKM